MEEKNPKKPTYEELEKLVAALKSQNTQFYNQLQNVNMSIFYKRLDYLFDVVKHREAFSSAFVNSCLKEIEEAITVRAENNGADEGK